MNLKLTIPPSINRTYGTTAGGRFYKTNRATAWVNEALWMIKSQTRASYDLTDKLLVSIELDFPDNRHRDIDNPIKSTLDVLQKAGIMKNDDQVYHLIVFKKMKCILPEMRIQIEKLNL